MRMASIRIDKSALACVFLATVIFICLILFAASDFRGTDQYWYVGDVETLLEGGKTTNNIYPAQILSCEAQIPCPFMHNILNLYLVLPAARIFGAFEGWVLTNILATILTASLIALLVATVADKWISILTYTVYLLLPLTVWQSAQPLAEATIAPFVALGVLTYVRAETNKKLWFLTVAAACAAYYCRTSFLPILFLVPIAFLLQNKPVRIKNAIWGLTFLSFAVLAVIIGKMIFVQGMPTSFHKVLNNAIPGVTSNMHFLFSTSPRPISLQEFWLKVAGHLSYQLLPHVWHLQIFYLPFNLLAALSLYLCFIKKSMLEVRVAHCAMSLLLLHIVTIMVHQNQFRYLLVVTPAVLAAGAAMLSRTKLFQSRRTQLGLILATLLLLTVSNAPLVTRLHREGLGEKELRTVLNATFDNIIPQDESLMVDASKAYNQIFGYVLRPRMVIFVKSNHKYEEYQAIQKKGAPKWLLCPLNSPLVDHLGVSSPPVFINFPHPYKDYALFQI